MGPRQLQSQIHSDYSTESDVWIAYRTGVSGLYGSASRKDDYSSHLIKEYNRKIDRLNQSTGLFIVPFDGGYGFIGTQILPPVGIETISGFAFPNETLSAPTGSSYLWEINGIATGTGSTFTPTIYDIGKTVSCFVDDVSYSTVVWHPNQISSVKAFWWANYGVYTSGGLTLAQDEQPVYQWKDIINNGLAIGGGETPSYMSTYEGSDIYSPSIQSDANDFEIVDETRENIFDGVKYAYCFMGAKDINPTSGAAHVLFSCLNDSTPILTFGTRRLSNSVFYLQATKSGESSVLISGTSANADYNVLTAEALFNDSAANLRVNGSVNASGALDGSSSVSVESSTSMYINRGYAGTTSTPSYITAVILAAGNEKMSNADRNKIERFIGLLGNIDVPLI